MAEHCWHKTGNVENPKRVPPLYEEVCCFCGRTRHCWNVARDRVRHGPHLGRAAPGLDWDHRCADGAAEGACPGHF